MKILFIVLILFLLSCGKQPGSKITLNLSIPSGTLSEPSSKSAVATNSSSKTFTSTAPIHIYLKITDNHGTEVFNDIVDLGNVAAKSYIDPTLPISIKPFSISSDVTALTITGHYIAQGLQAGGTICNNSGTGSSTGSGSSTNNNGDDEVFFADFNASSKTLKLADAVAGVLNFTPELKKVTFDKFAIALDETANYTETQNRNSTTKILESITFSSTGSSKPKLTAFSLIDNESGTEIKDPCTGKSISGITNQYGHLATNLPLKFSSSTFLKLKATQFEVDANKAYTPTELSVLRNEAVAANTISASNSFDLVTKSLSTSVDDCAGLNLNYGIIPTNNPHPSDELKNY